MVTIIKATKVEEGGRPINEFYGWLSWFSGTGGTTHSKIKSEALFFDDSDPYIYSDQQLTNVGVHPSQGEDFVLKHEHEQIELSELGENPTRAFKGKLKNIQIMEELKLACESYITGLRNKTIHEDAESKYTHDIFEKAMEHFYGVEVWDEINELSN